MSQFVNNPDHKFQFDTLALHVGQEEADPASDSRAVPIYQTTSYVSATPSMPPTASAWRTQATSTVALPIPPRASSKIASLLLKATLPAWR